ncbi:hypothetical protein [Halobacteriovorax marinus]|uniref:hypothetical protein n=1 Tax=Halobacteriovorax marinus TaxID=97084 RepID=UPI003A8FE0A4
MIVLKKFKNIVLWLPFVIFVCVLSTYILANFYGPYHQYWASQSLENIQERSIASSIGDLEYDAYRDYFFQNQFNKYINYKIESEIWSSNKEQRTSEITSAYSQAIKETLEGENASENSLAQVFQRHTLKTFIKKMRSHLKSKSNAGGELQIDIHFIPQFEQTLNYNIEHSTNNLVNVDQFNLKKELEYKEKSISEQILNSKVPSSHSRYQYNGGTISIVLNLEKEGSTEIRFRRFFKANSMTEPDLNIRSKEFKVTMFHSVSSKESDNDYITVDLIKNYNTQKDTIEKDKVIIHLGKILPSIKESGVWVKKLSDSNKTATITNDFFIHGRYSAPSENLKVKMKVDTLVYSLKDREFLKESKYFIKITSRDPASTNPYREREILKENFRLNTIPEVIKKLELGHFLYSKQEGDF